MPMLNDTRRFIPGTCADRIGRSNGRRPCYNLNAMPSDLHSRRIPRRASPDHASHPIADPANAPRSTDGVLATVLPQSYPWSCMLAGACSPQTATARAAPDSLRHWSRRSLSGGGQHRRHGNRLGRRGCSANCRRSCVTPPSAANSRRRFGNQRQQAPVPDRGSSSIRPGSSSPTTTWSDHADKIVVSLDRRPPAPGQGDRSGNELTDVAGSRSKARRHCRACPGATRARAEVGDWILAAGNPFGLGGSVSVGIISARGATSGPARSTTFCSSMRRSIPATPAARCSTWRGQVIGVSSVIVSPTGASVGIGFAIPSEAVSRIVTQLLSKGTIERGWLGVAVDDRDGGVTIASVDRTGPGGEIRNQGRGRRFGHQWRQDRHLPRTDSAQWRWVSPGNNIRGYGPPTGPGDGNPGDGWPPASGAAPANPGMRGADQVI